MKCVKICFGSINFIVGGELPLSELKEDFYLSENTNQIKKINLRFKRVEKLSKEEKKIFEFFTIKKIKRENFFVLYDENSEKFSFPFLVANAIQFIGTKEILKSGGIVLHGVAINHNGDGYVFLAKSEGGKTTLAKNFGGEDVLSDEFSIISNYPQKDGLWVWGGGILKRIQIKSCPKPAPLKRIYFIEKSPKLFLQDISFNEGFSLLLKYAVSYEDLWSKKQILKNASRILKDHKFAKLFFNKKDSIWKIIKD